MREYEAVIIAKADLPEMELSKMVSKWENIIGTDGGQIVRKDVWGVRKLAYPIRKTNRGYYFIYDVATTQNNVKELDRVLKLDENILRIMIIKLNDFVDVEKRRLELQHLAENSEKMAVDNARDRAESDSLHARRGDRDEEYSR